MAMLRPPAVFFEAHNRICAGCRVERRRQDPVFRCCADCKFSAYCGPECQRIHWQHHKALCLSNKTALEGVTLEGRKVLRWVRTKKGFYCTGISDIQARFPTHPKLRLDMEIEKMDDDEDQGPYAVVKIGVCTHGEISDSSCFIHVILESTPICVLEFPTKPPLANSIDIFNMDQKMVKSFKANTEEVVLGWFKSMIKT